MSYIEGTSRRQSVLFPEQLDEYIAQDNPVRFLDAFVDGLRVEELGFRHSVPEGTGRPPYDPRDLLKLYVYGYLQWDSLKPQAGAGVWEECGGDVAGEEAAARF